MCLMRMIEVLANIAAVAGAFISVIVFKHNVKRERQILTIDAFSKFREKYPMKTCEMSDDEKSEYLRDIEFFCVGVNKSVYDFKILQKMGGKRLISQYQNGMGKYVDSRMQVTKSKDSWCEYKKVIQRLKKYYSLKNHK